MCRNREENRLRTSLTRHIQHASLRKAPEDAETQLRCLFRPPRPFLDAGAGGAATSGAASASGFSSTSASLFFRLCFLDCRASRRARALSDFQAGTGKASAWQALVPNAREAKAAIAARTWAAGRPKAAS